MSCALHRFLSCTRGAPAIEAAISIPLFLILTVGIVNLGAAMFDLAAVNAAAQAGTAYAIINGTVSGSSFQTAMTNAANGLAIAATPAPTIGGCADGSPECITVTASYAFTPLIGANAFASWVPATFNFSATVTVRIK
jgi:Flp pilus assembly protein TadG